MTAKRQASDGDDTTTSSRHPKTRKQYADAGDADYVNVRATVLALNDQNTKIEEQESELNVRQKALAAAKKEFEDEEKEHVVLRGLEAVEKRAEEHFNRSKTAVSALIDGLGPGKPDLLLSSFKEPFAELNNLKDQLEDVRKSISGKKLLDDAKLEKLRSEQEQETKDLDKLGKEISVMKTALSWQLKACCVK